MRNLRNFIILCSIVIFAESCGKPSEIYYISNHDNGEKIGYLNCKSTSTTSVKTCEVPDNTEIDEILEVTALDSKDCTDNVGIYTVTKFWVLDLCNAWIKYRIKD